MNGYNRKLAKQMKLKDEELPVRMKKRTQSEGHVLYMESTYTPHLYNALSNLSLEKWKEQ